MFLTVLFNKCHRVRLVLSSAQLLRKAKSDHLTEGAICHRRNRSAGQRTALWLCVRFFACAQLITRCHCSWSPVATVCVLYGLPAPLPVSHLRRDISSTGVYTRDFRSTDSSLWLSALGLFSFLSGPFAGLQQADHFQWEEVSRDC